MLNELKSNYSILLSENILIYVCMYVYIRVVHAPSWGKFFFWVQGSHYVQNLDLGRSILTELVGSNLALIKKNENNFFKPILFLKR